MQISHRWLQDYFNDPLPEPEEVLSVVGAQAFEPEGSEVVDGDTVYDFDVLPNRAHDCLCHRGIAREVSTLFTLPLLQPDYHTSSYSVSDSVDPVSVTVDDSSRCDRYVTRRITGLVIGESPDWLKERLVAIGQRPINTVVDAANYVMFDIGQPLHAFDADKISGDIRVRLAHDGEQITTLDHQEVTLRSNDLVISDNDKALAIAGVKGGKDAEVTTETTSIILEAAHFDPVFTRRTSRGLKILTDSSKRFENTPTPYLAGEAMDLVTNLIVQIAGTDSTIVGPVTDVFKEPEPSQSVAVTKEHAERLLGEPISDSDFETSLDRNFFTWKLDGKTYMVTPPVWRLDVSIPEDIIEDVGRVYGYDHLASVLVPESQEPATDPQYVLSHTIRTFLAERGFSELYTYTFVDDGAVTMENVLASDKSHLRTSLHEKFSEAVEKNTKNAPLFGVSELCTFEIGTVFPTNIPDGERLHMIIGVDPLSKKARNKGTEDRISDYARKLGDILGCDLDSAVVERYGTSIEYNLSALLDTAQIPAITDLAPLPSYIHDTSLFTPFSQYPFVLRDVALWARSGMTPANLSSLISDHGGNTLIRVDLFDTFEKDGITSYAFRLVFQSHDATLTDDDVAVDMTRIEDALVAAGNEIR